jgi:hypothetical protein
MSSLETIHEEKDRISAQSDQDDCDYIIYNKDNTITVCREKIEKIIVNEANLYYKFGLIDGFLLGVVTVVITYTYKDRAAAALKTLTGTVKGLISSR